MDDVEVKANGEDGYDNTSDTTGNSDTDGLSEITGSDDKVAVDSTVGQDSSTVIDLLSTAGTGTGDGTSTDTGSDEDGGDSSELGADDDAEVVQEKDSTPDIIEKVPGIENNTNIPITYNDLNTLLLASYNYTSIVNITDPDIGYPYAFL